MGPDDDPGPGHATGRAKAVFQGAMDDTPLLDDLARDLDGSFDDLVRSHVDRCYAIALRVLGNSHDAEEVAQDALVRAYRAMAGYPPARIRDLRLRPWLATIVVNLCRNRTRRRMPATTSLDPLVERGREPVAGDAADPAGAAVRAAEREQLAALLIGLPDRYRIPVVLRHVDDLSYAELAEVLGRPEGTVKAQVSRGLVLLRAAAAGTELEELIA
jgi:RNA polymerase sigma-70 factor, ECF subfamily